MENTQTLDAETDAMHAAALEADNAGLGIDDVLAARAQPGNRAPESGTQGTESDAGSENKTPQSPESPPADTDKTTDAPTKDADIAPAVQQDAPPPPSDRKQKDAERLERSWQKLEAEKEHLRKREALLLQREQAAAQPHAQQPSDAKDGDPTLYEELADRYEAEGDLDMAKFAREKAQRLRRAAPQNAEQNAEQLRRQFQMEQQVHIAYALKEHPELEDPSSPFGAEVRQLLQTQRIFSTVPEGPRLAAGYVALKHKADRVPDLEAQVRKLTDENKQLRDSLQPLPAGVADRPPAKNFSDLSLDEQRAELGRSAAEADRR